MKSAFARHNAFNRNFNRGITIRIEEENVANLATSLDEGLTGRRGEVRTIEWRYTKVETDVRGTCRRPLQSNLDRLKLLGVFL